MNKTVSKLSCPTNSCRLYKHKGLAQFLYSLNLSFFRQQEGGGVSEEVHKISDTDDKPLLFKLVVWYQYFAAPKPKSVKSYYSKQNDKLK